MRDASGDELLFPIGDVIAETYEIRRLLGAGGAGQVFEAFDRFLDRMVALKVLSRSDAARAAPLLDEGKALAQLRHPGLTTVHSYGVHRGLPYIVMERLYGISLDKHLASRNRAGQRFAIAEAVELLIGLAEALRAVHRTGCAHRDIKPSNVMLTEDGRCVLTDFGLHTPEVSEVTRGDVVGTPLYIAPEAIKNEVEAGAYHLVDLYALGVLAFEVLTGKPPYDSQDVQRIYDMHVSAPVPDPGELRREVPFALRKLVMELMAKDPAARPRSVDSVILRLRKLAELQDEPARDPFSVLIVDDDPDFVEALGEELREIISDLDVQQAKDGLEALERVWAHAPDMILLDLHMPGMSGLEMCMHLRSTRHAEHTTVVCISGRVGSQDLEMFSRFGVTDFVPKGTGLTQRLRPILERACPGRLAIDS